MAIRMGLGRRTRKVVRALAPVAALQLIAAQPANARDCQPPEHRRLTNALVVASNSVGPGAINSAVGLLAIVGSAIAAPFSDAIEVPRLRWSRSKLQIVATIADHWYRGGTSLGLFLIEGSDSLERKSEEDYELHLLHEGGHAYQSALLGPLYLPVVGVDYALHGGGNHHFYFMHARDRGGLSRDPERDAFVERWADAIAADGGKQDDLSAAELRALLGCPERDRAAALAGRAEP